uniref:Putative secreted protein n=1 Tax=Anopheles marajoara TaxID=58244 RepID=A0A2M4CBY9_9DIPT
MLLLLLLLLLLIDQTRLLIYCYWHWRMTVYIASVPVKHRSYAAMCTIRWKVLYLVVVLVDRSGSHCRHRCCCRHKCATEV